MSPFRTLPHEQRNKMKESEISQLNVMAASWNLEEVDSDNEIAYSPILNVRKLPGNSTN